MVYISLETREQTEARLRRVIRSAQFEVYDDRYVFVEFDDADFPHAVDRRALAIVRDGERWSQLVQVDGDAGEVFGIFGFHFPGGEDNSGFVGWLASHLKERFGTGVFVICGYNRTQGGVFDYWGCPTELTEDVVAEIRRLRSSDE